MKNVIESVKDCWKGIINLFKDEPASYYYKLDEKSEPVKVCTPDDPKCPDKCGCKQTSDFTYDEEFKSEDAPVADELLDPVPEAPAPAIKSVSKADLSKMSKLELQVMAKNAGVILTGKEKKQQLVSKLAKHLAL
jgi:hypothetical protein